jgi:hypothetical protein
MKGRRPSNTHLNTVVAVRVAEELLEAATVQHLLNHHLASAVLRHPNTLLDDVRAELLHTQGTDVAGKLTDNTVAETVVVQVENVLHDLT